MDWEQELARKDETIGIISAALSDAEKQVTACKLKIQELEIELQKALDVKTSEKQIDTNGELLTTEEFADIERVAPQTIRKNFCLKGHHHGLKPIKLPNGGLRWRTSDVYALFT